MTPGFMRRRGREEDLLAACARNRKISVLLLRRDEPSDERASETEDGAECRRCTKKETLNLSDKPIS